MTDLCNSVTRRFPSPERGLTREQAEENLKNGAANIVTDDNSMTVKEIIRSNIFTYFNLIFAVLAALLILVHAYRGLTFLPVVLANTLIGIVQQIRSKRTLDRLNMLHAPKACVIRDGEKMALKAEEAVLDDVAVFSAGNQVYADSIILDGEVQVNESLLTGEADEITRRKGEMLMSGSFIVSGECRARLDKVGNASYIAQLSAQAKKADKREHSEIIASLNKLIKLVGIVIIPIGIIMFSEQYFYAHMEVGECVSSMVAALLGMIPEGLYLLASVALALSVMRLAHKKVNVHDMSCVETLARVNVLCVDKTGTITDNTMRVKKTVPLNACDPIQLDCLIGDFVQSMSNDNITMTALKEFFVNKDTQRADKIIPFSSKVKYSAAIFGDKSYVLGAPELVLRESFAEYEAEIKKYLKLGFRVLVFAEYEGNEFNGALTEKAYPMGLILLRNPVRKEAAETFKYFAEQGVKIKVISGDNPITVSDTAKEAGISGADDYIDASELHTDEEIAEAVNKYTVFGRVTPEMKRSLVHQMQAQGDTVAMTGDGVNDVLALKDADCSVAMASGSEAAANVAQIVLLESDFSRMPQVLQEGRRVVNNIERSAGLFLIKNIFSFLMAIFSMVMVVDYPLEPEQVSMINAFTIGTPAFLLALENNKNLIKGKFISNVMFNALPAALTDFITIGCLVMYCNMKGIDSSTISTLTTFVVSAIGFMVLVMISRPMNTFRTAVIAALAVGFLLCAHYMRWWFEIERINLMIVLMFAVFAALAAVILAVSHKCIQRLARRLKK